MQFTSRTLALLLAAAIGSILPLPALATGIAQIEPVRTVKVVGAFAGKKNNVGKDLSGLACRPTVVDGVRQCIAVNDENRAAQAAVLGPDGAIVVGKPVVLIGKQMPANVVGRQPQPPCPAAGGFEDFDGEGVAADGGQVYVTGSHGCSRKKGELRLSSFLLARFNWNDQREVELTYRLSDVLSSAGRAAPFFGRELMSANGMNVEGIAVLDGMFYAGLRAPSLDGRAFIVAASIIDLFAPGDAPLAVKPQVTEVPLGTGAGIRDLAALPEGKLLVLSGPAQEQSNVPYALTIVEAATGNIVNASTALTPVQAEDGTPAKAEAALLLGSANGKLRVLVMFDGLENGGPREYEVSQY